MDIGNVPFSKQKKRGKTSLGRLNFAIPMIPTHDAESFLSPQEDC